MQTLENFEDHQCGLLHDTNAGCRMVHTMCHTPQIHLDETI
jgi:hypothetical protein